MSHSVAGHVSASVIAGQLQDSNQPTSEVGHLFTMGEGDLYIHIRPETAQQWIDVLEPIAKEAE